jgi:hypothetical protein
MHDVTPRVEAPTLPTNAPRQSVPPGGAPSLSSQATAATLRTPPGDPRWAAAELWRTLSFMWLGLGLLALAASAAAPWALAEQASRDALGLGFLGSAAGALACALYSSLHPKAGRIQEALLLAAAFWSAAVTSVALAHAVVGQPWIWAGPAPSLALPGGCGLLLSLYAVRRQGKIQQHDSGPSQKSQP